MKHFFYFIIISFSIYSCTSIKKANSLEDGEYVVRRSFFLDSMKVNLNSQVKLYIEDFSDSLVLYKIRSKDDAPIVLPSDLTSFKSLYLRKNSFDVDLFTIPFKIRPAQEDVPTQFNTSFNASLYFGFRRDFHKISGKEKHPDVFKRKISSNGVGAGAFIGIGPVPINPTVTLNKINQEYDGFSLSYGIATIYAVEKFNAGVAFGFDYLTDRNKEIWIYHQKPWIGFILGLNLN